MTEVKDVLLEEAERQLSMALQAAASTFEAGKAAAHKKGRWRTFGSVSVVLLSIAVGSGGALSGITAITALSPTWSIIAAGASPFFFTLCIISLASSRSARASELSNYRESFAWDCWAGAMSVYIGRLRHGGLEVTAKNDPEWRELQRRRRQILVERWGDIELQHLAEMESLNARAHTLVRRGGGERVVATKKD